MPVTEDLIVSRFEDAIWHSEVPLPDTNGIGRLAMAEEANSHGIKVILTGLSLYILLTMFLILKFSFPQEKDLTRSLGDIKNWFMNS